MFSWDNVFFFLKELEGVGLEGGGEYNGPFNC